MEQSDFVHTGQKVGSRHGRGRHAVDPGAVAVEALLEGPGPHHRARRQARTTSLALVGPGRHRRRGRRGARQPRGRCSPTRWSEERRRSVGGPRLRAGDGAAGTRPRGIPRPSRRRHGQGGPPAAGRLADGRHGPVRLGAHRRHGRGAPARPARSAPTDASPPCPCRSPWAWRRRPSSSALVAVQAPTTGSDAAGDVPTLGGLAAGGGVLAVALRRRLGRAVDGRAGAPTRPRGGARCRARLAGSPRTRRSRPEPASPSARSGPGPCSGSRP